jgi:hypothetical protein
MFLTFSSVPRRRNPLLHRTLCGCRHPNRVVPFRAALAPGPLAKNYH